MNEEKKKPRRRWGAAILSWIGLLFLLSFVASASTNARYNYLNSQLGTNISPSFTVAPWWSTVLFLIACVYVGKIFLFPKDNKDNEEKNEKGADKPE